MENWYDLRNTVPPMDLARSHDDDFKVTPEIFGEFSTLVMVEMEVLKTMCIQAWDQAGSEFHNLTCLLLQSKIWSGLRN